MGLNLNDSNFFHSDDECLSWLNIMFIDFQFYGYRIELSRLLYFDLVPCILSIGNQGYFTCRTYSQSGYRTFSLSSDLLPLIVRREWDLNPYPVITSPMTYQLHHGEVVLWMLLKYMASYQQVLMCMLHDILDDDHIQWHPPLIGHYTNFWPLLIWTLLPNLTFYLIVQGFHRTCATGAACQQRMLTPPDTWSCPTLGLACVLMSRPIIPELVLSPDFWISNIPRYFSFAYLHSFFVQYFCVFVAWFLLYRYILWNSRPLFFFKLCIPLYYEYKTQMYSEWLITRPCLCAHSA